MKSYPENQQTKLSLQFLFLKIVSPYSFFNRFKWKFPRQCEDSICDTVSLFSYWDINRGLSRYLVSVCHRSVQ